MAQVVEPEILRELRAFEDGAEVPAIEIAGQKRPACGRGEHKIMA